MQTLWTRAAQVRISCHCPQCLPSSSAVARRAAATATRRAPRFWTSSTVWYSGIFAVAATLDLGVKQQRREQWNKAIADVKHDLARSDDAHANREFLDSLEQEVVALQDIKENLDSSSFRAHVPEWPASTGQERLINKLSPQSIYMHNYKKARHMLDRWMAKKLERVQLSMDALQLEFFHELHRHGWHEEAASAVPSWYAEHILQPVPIIQKISAIKHQDLNKIIHLKGKFSFGGEDEAASEAMFATWHRSAEDVPLCSYHQDELGQFHNTAYDLNSTLRKLFDLGRDRVLTPPAVLAKVYHNLSVSPAPPNIDTYNTLIVGLADIGTRRLVEDCISSLQCTRIRYNEVSLASILNYWTLTGNEEEFRYWVQLMRGCWGGLYLAQSGIQITGSSQGRLFRRKDGVRIVQRPSPTPMVFGALIKGVIKFSGFHAALDVCQAARDEGWGLCMSGLLPLLKDCSRRRDWPAGLATWNQIQALRIQRFQFAEPKPEGWKPAVIDLPTFASMLQLCTRCNNRTAFQDVMEQAFNAHPDSAENLIRMVRLERSEMQNATSGSVVLPNNVSDWLHTKHVLQHTDEFKGMPWEDIIKLDAEELKVKGVGDDSARENLLTVFQQAREAHLLQTTAQSPWLSLEAQRQFRRRVMKRPKYSQEERIWTTPMVDCEHTSKVEVERDESQAQATVQPGELETQRARHDEPVMKVHPLGVESEPDQQASYAVGMASISDQLHSVAQPYQPFGH